MLNEKKNRCVNNIKTLLVESDLLLSELEKMQSEIGLHEMFDTYNFIIDLIVMGKSEEYIIEWIKYSYKKTLLYNLMALNFALYNFKESLIELNESICRSIFKFFTKKKK